MKKKTASLLAAAASALLLLLAGAFYMVMFTKAGAPGIVLWITIVLSAAALCMLILALVQRFRELDKGEEDDLGKY